MEAEVCISIQRRAFDSGSVLFNQASGVAETSFCTQTAERLGVTMGEGSEAEDMIKNCAFSAYTGKWRYPH